VMTAWGTVATAVLAMQRGASDYVEKPWQNERLLATLRVQLQLRAALKQSERLQVQSTRTLARAHAPMVFASKAMHAVQSLIDRVADSEASVLITGEHGTGKDVVANALHAASKRASRSFVPVNAGALADGVFESELFGHVKGAFTDAKGDRMGCFELADGGTLFLDEIGTMPAGQQAKLLRVLQTGAFQPVGSSRTRQTNVRVLAATNVDISKEIARGAFREDLLYRLNTVEIHLPALRERTEDIAVLATHFLDKLAARYSKPITGFSRDALAALLAHPWPGNVRELEHTIERAVVLTDGHRDADALLVELGELTFRRPAAESALWERMTLADAEAHLIRKTFERCQGNATLTAEALGLSRSACYRRLQALGITVQE
jgi:DNA-binding NtrC family response regulator